MLLRELSYYKFTKFSNWQIRQLKEIVLYLYIHNFEMGVTIKKTTRNYGKYN